ncbi:ATP-dependent Clp protease, protease subunit [Seinonella peptonophila]|uniref:ATP-dependent Clp protease proteolytic subunit n=1 Tax=Seinonella peptonophila TaxID=112248 RepID=A0A1M5A671_9BACL|nr:ATP-dependent Clp protease proteolytic subunit [Seinonella peptonophila]SHF25791.1 ATP-dependent Clp protease, protease subunit [Seinonella peptonophila]
MTTIPYVIESTDRGERSYDIYSRMLKDRIIFLGTGIDDQVANSIIAQLLFLAAEDDKKDINLYINSPGGSVTSGLAIFDTMQLIKPDVSTIAIGLSASAAATILVGGAKGKRLALPNAEILIHQPWVQKIEGQATDIKIQADNILKHRKRINQIYSERTKQPLSKIEQDMERDHYLTAEEALEYGIIDKIVG